MSEGDIIFSSILKSASADELRSIIPPHVWMESWTVENGCSPSKEHARAHWDEMRISELANREREPDPKRTYNTLNPLDKAPWKSVLEIGDKLGYSRFTIYGWKKDPTMMPKTAKRLLLFYIMAPAHITNAVLALEP